MRRNRYICQKCKKSIYTINDDVGVTPFMLRCRATKGCDGAMESQFGRVREEIPPTHEWYWATDAEAEKMGPDEFHHHKLGGAFIRKIEEKKRPKLKRLFRRSR